MPNIYTLAAALANTDKSEIMRLEQFAWFVDNAGDDRSAIRLAVLRNWAQEMSRFQTEANRTGEPVEYFQRGRILRVLCPQTDRQVA